MASLPPSAPPPPSSFSSSWKRGLSVAMRAGMGRMTLQHALVVMTKNRLGYEH